MPFPIHPPRQMPCPHWQHFPITPAVKMGNCPQSPGSLSPPPSPDSYMYCSVCNAKKDKA
ncbi:uncharacterized protein LOC119673402 [Teleopsis dalmanni]|uniref:uncharacterized protein LOC119673402 n=1 Tax=Teleopsis dalmanni TaxID=139649 RepID=UPI0018CD026C|nr:uncharacterized protein LOC119673402 [Teleopsis dalmanni]